jgi:hypothetical protein
MKQIINSIFIPRECVRNLVISLAAVAVFLCAAIIPAYLKWLRLDARVSDVRYRIEEQKTLLPLFDSLKTTRLGSPATLQAPDKIKLDKSGIDSALMKLRDISDKAAMNIISIRPDLTSTPASAQSVAVNMSLRGSFENFRGLLAGLGALPYVENIENISIQQGAFGKMLDFKIKILLSVA